MSEMDYNEYKKTALNQLKERFKQKKNYFDYNKFAETNINIYKFLSYL